jgi:hypothetical protein
MKKKYVFIVLFFTTLFVFSQQTDNVINGGLNYKEDQFYAGITYNLFGKKESDISQSGFSTGFHFGFIKDMPINKNRNVAIGLGIGYSTNSFNQNILVNKDNTGNLNYSILDGGNVYTKNKFSMHLVEIPIEFRWRTSTETEYSFWRIYTGFKFGYVFANTTKHIGDLGTIKYNNIKDFNKIQYGLTLSMGYSTWNVYMYYALNPIFSSDAKLNGSSIGMNAIKIGLMFYIL